MNSPEKESLRRELSARRSSLKVAELESTAAAIADRLLDRPEVLAAAEVGLYWSHRGEVATAPAIRRLAEAGKKLFLPRIEGQAGEARLVFARLGRLEDLQPGAFGILEPKGGEAREAASLPVLVIPGLAFDLSGGRIGWGRGYYDRALRGYAGARLALAYEFQVFARVPVEAHDEKVDVLLTESRVIECREGT